jgi:plasmid stabilization system protein ParE
VGRFEVEVTPWAVTDVHNQTVYFLDRGELQAAERFEKCVREGLEHLEEDALYYQKIDEVLRRCPLEPFQHGLLYEVDGDKVVVHAVAHGHQKPRDWRQRSRK